jgi:hypothetical protein
LDMKSRWPGVRCGRPGVNLFARVPVLFKPRPQLTSGPKAMPVLLTQPEEWDRWLSGSSDGDGIAKAFSTAIVGTGEKSDQVLTDRDSGGVEFLGENGGGPGVRLKPPKAKGKRSVPG